MVYLKPKQLKIKDCARRFVLKLYRHEASRGLFATAELLVLFVNWFLIAVLADRNKIIIDVVLMTVSVTDESAIKSFQINRRRHYLGAVVDIKRRPKPQSNGPLYSNTVIVTLTVDGCMGCYIWYSEQGTGRGRSPPRPLLAVPNVTAHPSTANVPTSYYSTWHYNYCPLKG